MLMCMIVTIYVCLLEINIPTYIPLTLYPQKGSNVISEIPPRHPH
jgi:hypothetical protein